MLYGMQRLIVILKIGQIITMYTLQNGIMFLKKFVWNR